MRTLLICTGAFLTVGTFVAAERLTSSAEDAVAQEQRAALDAQVQQSAEEFANRITTLQGEKDSAQEKIALLTGAVENVSAARDALTTKVTAAEEAASALRETLSGLEAQNGALTTEVSTREAALVAKDAELEALNAKVETLTEELNNVPAIEAEELVAEIASLNLQLSSRDETISTLEGELQAAEAEAQRAAATAETTEAGDPALAEELAAALARIDELTTAADPALAEELASAQATIDELTVVAEQAEQTEAEFSVINATLRERDETIAELQAQLSTIESGDEPSEGLEALSGQLVALNELLDEQRKTISNLRMGFEAEPASSMEMASACIERANKIFEISQIQFATGTSSISEQSTTTLDHLRDLAIGCESDDMFIEIGGHTDSLGSETDNQRLSEARAQSVRTFLVGRGIPEATMVAVGYGESQPIASNDTQDGRAQNRRITFTWQMREAPAQDVVQTDTVQ